MKTLFILAASTTILLVIVLGSDPTSAGAPKVISKVPDRFENYDLRFDTTDAGRSKLAALRGQPNTGALVSRSDARFKTEFNQELGVVEIIAPKGDLTRDFLAVKNGRARAGILKDFVGDNRSLFGIVGDQLRLIADYRNPDGKLGFAHFTQQVNGIPIFGAEVKAGFSRSDSMFRVINSLAPALDANAAGQADFSSPESAIISAASHIGIAIGGDELVAQSVKADERRFSHPKLADTIEAEKFFFPVGNGVVRPSWRILLWTDGPAYYVVVDASDGSMLWRKNLTEEQLLPATYSVYGNSTSPLKTADSPSAYTPGCLSPIGCAQPPAVARTSFTLVGNEGSYFFNNTGWIPDSGLPVRTPANPNITDGNNVEAGIDRMAPTGVDDNGWAFGSPTRVFNQTYNPAPGMPPPGEEPLPGMQTYPPSAFQQGVIAHGFYTVNRWHDEMYLFGFNEPSGNFQHSNFGRGGSEEDRVSFEMQDHSGTNGANFSTTADGGRPRLQMFIWTGSTPDRDGALDTQVVTHEMTHGLTGRLHGNATGLSSNMARGMGEGWSDFYSLALLSEPTDSRLGTYTVGGYITYNVFPGFEANYYYGIRRFPTAVLASLGPNGLPHNPLTWRYVNAGCNTLIGTDSTNPNSAFPRGPIGSTSPCDQIHNLGELWSVTLWEVRDQLIERHGALVGNRRAIQYITDGMKLSPLNPTVLNSRDAIVAAAIIADGQDLPPILRGFAVRGLGAGASIQNVGNGNNTTAMTESFMLPSQFQRPTRADFDGDGKSDISVFRPSDRIWYLDQSSAGFAAINWGLATDELVPDDFDGDGKTDLAIYRATADGAMPDFYIVNSATSTISYVSWGTTGDVAVSEDFDGDNKADHAIYRASSSTFWIRRSTDGSTLNIGPLAGTPIVGDWDGDARGDVGSFNNGTWRFIRSGTGWAASIIAGWGQAGDRPVHGDYDGDGRDDYAVYRPSNGTWYIAESNGGATILHFGISTDTPVPADYDGDTKTDIAVYRDGIWYVNGSTSGIVISTFGLAGDMPLAASYIP